MARRYQQFLGSRPGNLVELLDDLASPYRVRTLEGFEFAVSADDFRNYYRAEGESTPAAWNHLISDSGNGFVDSKKMSEVVDIIRSFETVLKTFDRARSFARDALRILENNPKLALQKFEGLLEGLGVTKEEVSRLDVQRLMHLDDNVRTLILSEIAAVIPIIATGQDALPTLEKALRPLKTQARKELHSAPRAPAKGVPRAMKNVVIDLIGDILRIRIDLSRNFGPSKSGKTTIIASTEGSRSLPGRDEKIGLSVYRQESRKQQRGRRRSFKNVEVDVLGDSLDITIDLSKEFGASKSGKTVIVASTEGNQLVFGREERIGLNVYKKVD